MSLLGSSWITTIFGYTVVVLDVANHVVVEQGLPTTTHGWITFIGGIVTGVGIAMAKDFNKSHSPVPEAEAKPVAP